jgi:predicted small lipoprotein YifL
MACKVILPTYSREDQPVRKSVLLLLLVMGVAGLTACGQKGPLFLPPDEKPVEKPQASSNQ